MPELPEVESVRIGLLDIEGLSIQKVELGLPHCIKSLLHKDSLDLMNLEGQKIIRLFRKGKYLYIELEAGVLMIHLGMSGVLIRGGEYRKHTHYKFFLSDGSVVHYSDPRRFGVICLSSSFETQPSSQTLGPDSVNDTGLLEEQFKLVTKSQRDIKTLLLDQKILAGVGNIYACEALFKSKISPLRKGTELSLEDWKRLLKCNREILLKSIENRGTTFSDYRLSNGKEGEFKNFLKVFQKEHEDCPECEEVILKIKQAGRSTFYCENCQV
jgi:formamidopyrimidine-DNA glycosylase